MSEHDADMVVSGRVFGLLIVGFALVFVGVSVIIVASLVFGDLGSVGGVILIGPIPIVFGSGPDATWLIALSVILTIISLTVFVVLNRRAKRSR
jgi:uncharacterized membrane protein